MKKEKLIMTVWRVTKEQQKWVKKQAGRAKVSEAELVRYLITNAMTNNLMIYDKTNN